MIRKSLQEGASSSAVNSHLPSAESTGVGLRAFACLRTGPELDLDGIAISYFDVRNLQFGFQRIVFFQIVVALVQSNTASAVGVISMISRDLIVCFGSDLDLEVCRNDIQTILGGAFQIEFAGQGRAGANGIQAGTLEFESTHQLQGAADFAGLLILILTTANEQPQQRRRCTSGKSGG